MISATGIRDATRAPAPGRPPGFRANACSGLAVPGDRRGAAPWARAAASSSGFTLVELLVAVTLSAILLLGVLTTVLLVLRTGVRITHYSEMASQVRTGLETLGNDLRGASAIKWNGTSDLTLTVPQSDGSTAQVTYAWTGASQSLFRVPGTDSSATAGRLTLITGIPPAPGGGPGLTFVRFDAAGDPTTSDQTTRRIQVTLTVARGTASDPAATENGVSETFVLRNKPAG